MNEKMQKKLLEILGMAEENTAILCCNTISYMFGDEQIDNEDYPWGEYYEQIIKNDKFITDRENMQLFIKLKI